MLHVDDILYVGNQKRCVEVERCIAQFQHSGFSYLSESEPTTFCGVEIRRNPDMTAQLSQEDFYEKISPPLADDLIDSSRTFKLHKEAMRRHLKSFVGACIWLYQTRYDIMYEVGRLASAIPDALGGVKAMISFCKSFGDIGEENQRGPFTLKIFPMGVL